MSKTAESPETINIGPQPGPQTMFLSTLADVAIFGGSAGGGKLLPLDTQIPTPYGFVAMADIKPGDLVFDEMGKVCSVTKVFAVEASPELYRLTFDDGTTMDACVDHQWLTYTAHDLARLTRSSEVWKATRRDKRVSRAKTIPTKSPRFLAALLLRNKTIKNILTPTQGSVKTTREIIETLKVGTRANHAIPVAAGIDTAFLNLPIDPYLLGLWLGDGHSHTGIITTADLEITSTWTKIPSAKYGYRIPGLTELLGAEGLLNNKHIPPEYLRASREQRLSLLQGLMDTDGTTAKTSGSVQFDNTNENLVDGVIELACSLGHKPGRKVESRAMLYNKDCGPVWSVKWMAKDIVFRIERKKVRQKLPTRRTTTFRYITNAEKIPPRPGRCISVSSPSKLFLAGERFIPTHNSFGLLLEPIRHLKYVRKFASLILRRNTTQIRNPGGLLDESMLMYPLVGGVFKDMTMEWLFPNGDKIKFAHLEYEKTVHEFQGSQIPLIMFDELTHFSESQFWYMFSRNRSASGVRGYIRATTNPDADSWVRQLLDWWIGPDGFPIKERSGVLRWFIRIDGNLVWADSKEELIRDYGPEVMPKSLTFIPSRLEDNKILMDKDPSYKANLLAQNRVERDRLLLGNWNSRASAGNYFKRDQIHIIDAISGAHVIKRIRYWDRAATKPNETNKDPDWTVGLKLALLNTGAWVIEHVVRIRDTPGKVEELIKSTALIDSYSCPIGLEQDPGSAGVNDISYMVRALAGFNIRVNKPTKNKTVRASPVSAQCQHGNLYMIRAPWNTPVLQTLENFSDDGVGHDDDVDALSGAFNELSQGNSILDVL